MVVKYGAFSVCWGLVTILRLPKSVQCIFSLYPDPYYVIDSS